STVSAPATISGNLQLGPFYSGFGEGSTATGVAGQNTTHRFIVNDTFLTGQGIDLDVSANVSGTADVSWTRSGAGTMRLTGNNTFAGPSIIAAGQTIVASDTAFGSGLLSIQGGTIQADTVAHSLANAVGLDDSPVFFGSSPLTFTGLVTLSG